MGRQRRGFLQFARHSYASYRSIPNSLHVVQENLLTAAVIEFRSPAVGMAGDPLSGFKGAIIFQKIRDPGRPE